MKITVIGCGRWGSFITWYLDSIGHQVFLYGRKTSAHMQRFLKERKNNLLTLPESVGLSTDLSITAGAEVIVISVNSQGLQKLMDELKALNLREKKIVLCMKGIEIETGRRLSQIAEENLDKSNVVAVWLGRDMSRNLRGGFPTVWLSTAKMQRLKRSLWSPFQAR